jgi:hypothetical protein
MTLSPGAIHDLNWWYTSMSSAYNPISQGELHSVLQPIHL